MVFVDANSPGQRGVELARVDAPLAPGITLDERFVESLWHSLQACFLKIARSPRRHFLPPVWITLEHAAANRPFRMLAVDVALDDGLVRDELGEPMNKLPDPRRG